MDMDTKAWEAVGVAVEADADCAAARPAWGTKEERWAGVEVPLEAELAAAEAELAAVTAGANDKGWDGKVVAGLLSEAEPNEPATADVTELLEVAGLELGAGLEVALGVGVVVGSSVELVVAVAVGVAVGVAVEAVAVTVDSVTVPPGRPGPCSASGGPLPAA